MSAALPPLAIRAKLVFTPVDGDVKGRREVTRVVNLGPGSASVWTVAKKPRYDGPIWIDSDGDGEPDTQVRGSNFIAGMSPGQGDVRFATWTTYTSKPTCPRGYCPKQSCHCNPNPDQWNPDLNGDGCADSDLHCVWVCVASGGGGASGAIATACLEQATPATPASPTSPESSTPSTTTF